MIALAMLFALPATAGAAATQDWSTVTTRKADGAFVQGNPDARVKLVEYLSLTCPHCAHFEDEGIAPLTAKYISTGLVSYEVRHALRDAFDFAASVLTRCNGPASFFATAPIMFAKQDEWMAHAAKWAQTAPDAKSVPPEKLLTMVANGAGLPELLAPHGLTAAKADQCLNDAAARDQLTKMASEAWKRPNFPGTPTFLINGAQQDGVTTWAELDKRLAAALK
jgi:protein-disulfide isomerase